MLEFLVVVGTSSQAECQKSDVTPVPDIFFPKVVAERVETMKRRWLDNLKNVFLLADCRRSGLVSPRQTLQQK
jgi:hypothetical protein